VSIAQHRVAVPIEYENPLNISYPYDDGVSKRTVTELRDPAIIREGDIYYLTFTAFPFTHSPSRDANKRDYNSPPGIMLYSSPDLKHWKFEKWLVKSSELPEDCPYKHRFWAPEIHKINGKFFLIFTADNWIKDEYNKGGEIGAYVAFVGVSDKVTGPYEHITRLKGAGCDTTLFGDDDGKTYAIMPFGNEYIQEVDLRGIAKGDIKLVGERKMIVAQDNSDVGKKTSPEYMEDPWMIKRNGKYILFTAAPYKDGKKRGEQSSADTSDLASGYWVGAAVADNLWGSYKKQPQVFLGGHIAVFDGLDGREWFSYRGESGGKPQGRLCITPIQFNKDGSVKPFKPSTDVTWYPVPLPEPPKVKKVLLPAARDVNAPGDLPARKLFDYGTRDPHILKAPDGYYYMVATAEANSLPKPLTSSSESDFWMHNDGIPLWRSKDLTHWETIGYIWTFEQDATWARTYTQREGKPARAIWAPEIHYIQGTYWIPYSHNWGGTGIRKSTSGKPEGPYVDIETDGPLTVDIDSSLFLDDDGQVYLLEAGYRIAKMKPDLSGLAEPLRNLDFIPAPPWGEGINMQRRNGLYIWSNAGNTEFPWRGKPAKTYDCFSATATNIYGPYTNRYRAIPYAWHNNLFQDPDGNWFSTLFHPSPGFDWDLQPGIVPIEINDQGLITMKRFYPRPVWRYVASAPQGDWSSVNFDDSDWKTGEAGFGDSAIQATGPITDVGTEWKTGGLWLRKSFVVTEPASDVSLFIRHSGSVRVWLNGREVFNEDARWKTMSPVRCPRYVCSPVKTPSPCKPRLVLGWPIWTLV
jgi:beta-xylosidase